MFTFGVSSEFSRESSGFLFAFIGFRPPDVFGRDGAVEVGGGDSRMDLGLALDVDLVLGLGGPRYPTGQVG